MNIQCKAICNNGKRCRKQALIEGHCITHYWKLKNKNKRREKGVEIILRA